MKRILFYFFIFFSPLSIFCQVNNLEAGNECFKKGDYSCAESKYKDLLKYANGKDKQIAEIKFQRAKKCNENLKLADVAFKSKIFFSHFL